jgi:NADPH-dependent F420 reductase
MDIAIIGAGNVGGALAAAASRAGHQVVITAASRDSAEETAARAGARVAGSNREAAEAAEVVILAVPFDAIDEILGEAGDAIDGKVVVDVTNRMDMEDPASVIDGGSNAETIQSRAPEARVVKAFNYALASRQADPSLGGEPLDGFVAGDDQEAKAKVLDLVESIGFRPIDAGSLAMSRALEAMAVLNMSLNMGNDWSWQSGWKLVGPLGSEG